MSGPSGRKRPGSAVRSSVPCAVWRLQTCDSVEMHSPTREWRRPRKRTRQRFRFGENQRPERANGAFALRTRWQKVLGHSRHKIQASELAAGARQLPRAQAPKPHTSELKWPLPVLGAHAASAAAFGVCSRVSLQRPSSALVPFKRDPPRVTLRKRENTLLSSFYMVCAIVSIARALILQDSRLKSDAGDPLCGVSRRRDWHPPVHPALPGAVRNVIHSCSRCDSRALRAFAFPFSIVPRKFATRVSVVRRGLHKPQPSRSAERPEAPSPFHRIQTTEMASFASRSRRAKLTRSAHGALLVSSPTQRGTCPTSPQRSSRPATARPSYPYERRRS